MRVVQCLSHAIESYDMLRLYQAIGVEAFDIGPYIDPAHPHVDIRPPLPDAPFFPDLKQAVDDFGSADNLGAAQSHIPDALLDWLGDDGAIVFHHILDRLIGDWPRLKDWMDGAPGRRIIWRSVGQSVEYNERQMAPLRAEGLERVAYSPREANIPGYTGHDALIRFYKDPDEWGGWTGEESRVVNISQHDRTPHARDEWLNWTYFERATEGLPVQFAGIHSDVTGGLGALTTEEMQDFLRKSAVYLYTGTQPASYTLGLIEAMMTGIPVASIGPSWMMIFPYGPELFEGADLTGWSYSDPMEMRTSLEVALGHPELLAKIGAAQRERAIELFGRETIERQWREYLVR